MSEPMMSYFMAVLTDLLTDVGVGLQRYTGYEPGRFYFVFCQQPQNSSRCNDTEFAS